jgi:hypothetical protein
MIIEQWLHVVAASVVPVVVISACGLLCLAFYNRLAAVVARLRAFHRERLHEQDLLDRRTPAATSDPAAAEAARRHAQLLDVLEEQTSHVARRARLVRSTLSCLLCAIGCLTLCSVLTGLSLVAQPLVVAAVVAFVLGMALLLLAVAFALLELRQALDPVELESRFVARVTDDEPAPDVAPVPVYNNG